MKMKDKRLGWCFITVGFVVVVLLSVLATLSSAGVVELNHGCTRVYNVNRW